MVERLLRGDCLNTLRKSKMKKEQEVNNQYRVIRRIYNNQNGTFKWDDLKSAIDELIKMKMDMEFHVPILNIHPEFDEE